MDWSDHERRFLNYFDLSDLYLDQNGMDGSTPYKEAAINAFLSNCETAETDVLREAVRLIRADGNFRQKIRDLIYERLVMTGLWEDGSQ